MSDDIFGSSQPQVLLVDSDPAALATLNEALTQMGYDIAQSADLNYVKVLMVIETYDLVFIDVDMDGGEKMVSWMAKNAPTQRVIAITAKADVKTAIELMKRGATDYLEKPMPIHRIRELLEPASQDPARLEDSAIRHMAPREIAGYEINGMLGEGGTSVVFDATWNGKHVALKLFKERDQSPAKREQQVTRFLREASILMDIRHPNVLQAYDIGVETLETGVVIPYIGLEYIDGTTLMDVVGPNSTIIDLPTRADILSKIADGIDAVHRHKVVHRDVKPDNMVVTNDGRVKLVDFGIALTPDSTLTGPDDLLGSPVFMAPESFDTSAVDFRADIFSFGTTMYYFMLNELPFAGNNVPMVSDAVRYSEPRHPLRVTTEFPAALTRIMACLLAKHPDDRYQSAADVAVDLTAFANDPFIAPEMLPCCPEPTFWL